MMMGKMMAQQSGLEIILPSIILPEFGVSRWLITGSLGPTSLQKHGKHTVCPLIFCALTSFPCSRKLV
jgi:hypothetical protein